MSIALQRLLAIRPIAYHITVRQNIESIASTGSLRSPRELLSAADRVDDLQRRRETDLEITLDGRSVIIRGQAPLRISEMDLADGYSFECLLLELNRRVFFWPGNEAGPKRSGQNHLEHASGRIDVAILRCGLEELLKANEGRDLYVCKYNSGGPRRNPTKGRSPRGRDTFLRLGEAVYKAGEVAEISFIDSVRLPPDTDWSTTLGGPWLGLFPGVQEDGAAVPTGPS